MLQFRAIALAVAGSLALAAPAFAGKLSIVIDDFGYRPQTENQVLALPATISVAVLPNAPHAREMATKAHNQGHEVLIHLPMAPLSKQPLEKDTLRPEMSSEEIERIIREAYGKVPYAVGLNNHMGSAMTSNLFGMQKVMQALERYNLYFLDSVTIGNTQAMRAAQGTGVKVIKRKVFLDDTQNEADIRNQFNRAIALARRNGSAIAIGHPHPTTVRVLQQMVYNLPPDITLVRPSSLLNEPQVDNSTPNYAQPPAQQTQQKPRNPFHGVKSCKPKRPLEPVNASRFFTILSDSISQSALIQYYSPQMAGLGQPRQLDYSGVRSLLRDGRLVIFVGVPRLKIFQKAVKRRVQAGHHADLAIAPRPAKQIPLKESANGADDPPRQRRFDLLVLHQPGGIAVQLIKHFMQRIKGIVANEARQPDGARVSDHLVIHRPIVKPRLLAVKEAHRVIR
ncbi:polysaccharide deacetylase family protein [Klebsiella pneumoniae]|uniref:Polysaccharide deacetylase family protein n=22 Tax=Gammaproteobacteria TaxID=1236 RepID=A0A2X3BY92_KLEPN|nr:polysaccharide deacetylase family protein [Klebsiella pneumoniae]